MVDPILRRPPEALGKHAFVLMNPAAPNEAYRGGVNGYWAAFSVHCLLAATATVIGLCTAYAVRFSAARRLLRLRRRR